jgi:hypothetical protein
MLFHDHAPLGLLYHIRSGSARLFAQKTTCFTQKHSEKRQMQQFSGDSYPVSVGQHCIIAQTFLYDIGCWMFRRRPALAPIVEEAKTLGNIAVVSQTRDYHS